MNQVARAAAVFLLLFLLGCAPGSGGDGGLRGTWKFAQQVTNGKEASAEALSKAPTVTFEGNKMIRKRDGKVKDTWTYKVDTNHSPKRMTITMGEPGKEKDYHHYYTLEGDTLTMSHANAKFSNPVQTRPEPGAHYTVYTRVK